MQVPCFGCGERAVGCHSVCRRHRAFQASRRAVLQARREYIEKNTALYEMARKLRRRK